MQQCHSESGLWLLWKQRNSLNYTLLKYKYSQWMIYMHYEMQSFSINKNYTKDKYGNRRVKICFVASGPGLSGEQLNLGQNLVTR